MKKKTSPLSAAIEDYLKAIYQLRASSSGGAVMTSALAAGMQVSAASATNMIKKLATMKLARHSPYRGVELTPAGEKIALEIVRHHRLIELFLSETLGIPWDEVHVEAHKLEHVLSDNLEDHLAQFLGNPTQDPHGDPIPTKAGVLPTEIQTALSDLAPGARATIRRVIDQDPAHLRYLSHLGAVPGATVRMIAFAPFDGPVRIRIGTREHSLDRALARNIWVIENRRK
jgi:DtxR family transcriptional regulator, Mn-dependent transcriptional regulator